MRDAKQFHSNEPICRLPYGRAHLVLLVRRLDQGIQAGEVLVDLVLAVVLGSL